MIVLTPKQMNRLDAYAINELMIPGIILMEHAAAAVAQKALEMLEGVSDPEAVVFAGTGNNGGDGFAIARLLMNKGVKPFIYLFGDMDRVKGDARVNLDICIKMGLPLVVYRPEFMDECIATVQKADLAVDALLGTGYSGALRQPVIDGIRILNEYAKKVLSVDIPSGVNGETGKVDEEAVKACETVTFCCPKPGLTVYPGKEMAGKLTVAPIQIPKSAIERMSEGMHYIDEDLVREWLPQRKVDSNKGDFGRVTVATGAKGMTGAAILAAKAAYRTGSGLVYMLTDPDSMPVLETTVVEAVKIPVSNDIEKEPDEIRKFLDKQDCVVIGPGMGNNERTFRMVKYFLSRGGNLVLDADGLNVLENKTDLLKESPCNIVITPHPGEMSRLCGKSIREVQSDRLATAHDFAVKTGVTVVLKGAATVVCTKDVTMINSTGCPGMAVAGSGDVLAGMIGSLIGQGLTLLKACALGVFLHGLAGEYAQAKLTEYGVTASDIIDMVPSAYKAIGRNYIPSKERFELTCT